ACHRVINALPFSPAILTYRFRSPVRQELVLKRDAHLLLGPASVKVDERAGLLLRIIGQRVASRSVVNYHMYFFSKLLLPRFAEQAQPAVGEQLRLSCQAELPWCRIKLLYKFIFKQQAGV